ncbi:magnesium chelatase subunit D [Limnohabitans sp.]|jgi:magnesium chelatase subunit D|uniref:magnesium chelatase subunit D n=1 Tax=Limnohabitans sp. TaxID=1907725 RepID=UPI0037BF5D19
MSNALRELEIWNDALTALQLLQIDPHGFGGVWLRAPFGPVRDQWLRQLASTKMNTIKLPGSVDLERLLGGIDLSLTLQTGQLHLQSGLLAQAHQGLVCISMAERFPASLMAPLTQAMDTQCLPPLRMSDSAQAAVQTTFGVLALDESVGDDLPISPALQERLGLWLNLQELPPSAVSDLAFALQNKDSDEGAVNAVLSAQSLAEMRPLLQRMQFNDEQATAICATAMGLGIDSLRVPSLALRVACVHAALHLRSEVVQADLAFATRAVLAPRATQWPTPPDNASDPTQPTPQEPEAASETQAQQPPPQDHAPPPTDSSEPPSSDESEQDSAEVNGPSPHDLKELLIAAALASLPADILERLMTKTGSNTGQSSGRSGTVRSGMQRGRPLPPRPGRPGGLARLHVLATLRAAAPKQRLRSGTQTARVAIRSEDFHVHRYQQNSATCLILALDASGSAALQRLAEAKGAVELLLQQSYARRDSVCIVAFRGAQAQLLLPMTRSLVRAKRAMTGLPGGGGTPLALALKMACEQAQQLHRQGVTPLLVVLSDGRANISLAGVGGREQAQADAVQWAAQWRLTGHRSMWIDTSVKPDAQVQNMASTMGGHYLPMPQVQAHRMASAMDHLRRL